MAMVRPRISAGIVRLNTFTCSWPFRRLRIIKSRRVKLVVLMPPPVEPGEAPMNMRTINRRIDALVSWPMSTVLKPQVLAVTDWKRELRNTVAAGASRRTL